LEITSHITTVDFPVVDFHLHLPVEQDDWLKPWRDRYVSENGAGRLEELVRRNENRKSWLPEYGFPEPDPPFSDWQEASDRWYGECLRAGLGRAVFLTGGGNDTLARAVRRHPDIFCGFAHHDPEEKDAAHKLERAVCGGGLCGYKILAPTLSKPLSDRSFDDLFEVANTLRLPVVIHFGILGGGSGNAVIGLNRSPIALAETASRFPSVRFIVPHFGCGYPDDLLTLCWACANVSVDTSGNNLWTKWTMANWTLEQLFARFCATIGPSRILFGSDSEWFPRGFAMRYLLDQLRAVRALNLPEGDIERIFRANALEMLER